jgi:hypothetical protein
VVSLELRFSTPILKKPNGKIVETKAKLISRATIYMTAYFPGLV